jgi:hypothetical protein
MCLHKSCRVSFVHIIFYLVRKGKLILDCIRSIVVLNASASHFQKDRATRLPTCKLFVPSTLILPCESLSSSISVVMISRLMLNLRSPSLIQGKASVDSDFCSSMHHHVSTVVHPLPCDTFVDMRVRLEPSQGGYLGKDSNSISGA